MEHYKMRVSLYIPLISILIYFPVYSQSSKVNHENAYSIAYNIHENESIYKNNYEIVTMDTDGSNKKNITHHPDVAWTYYAYKKRLYFISDRDTCFRCFFLYETDVNGKEPKRISDLMLEDSWMSGRNQGDEIVVAGRQDINSRYQLYIINTLTGDYHTLTNDTAAKYGDPCFSPDGKKIVFYYKKNKRDRNSYEELFIMNDDGTQLKQLTFYPENNSSAKEFGYRAGAARWHPTENFISYISKQDGRHSIFAITPDGKRQWKLIESESSDAYHDWSPDGQLLIYNQSDNEESQYHIILMNWKTKEQKQLTDNSYKSQLSPVFIEK